MVDGPAVDRLGEDGNVTVLKAQRLELHGRMVEGSATNNPVIEVVVRATAAAAPDLHPLTAQPLDAEIAARCAGWPISRRNRGRCGFAKCRRATAASRSAARGCSRAT